MLKFLSVFYIYCWSYIFLIMVHFLLNSSLPPPLFFFVKHNSVVEEGFRFHQKKKKRMLSNFYIRFSRYQFFLFTILFTTIQMLFYWEMFCFTLLYILIGYEFWKSNRWTACSYYIFYTCKLSRRSNIVAISLMMWLNFKFLW